MSDDTPPVGEPLTPDAPPEAPPTPRTLVKHPASGHVVRVVDAALDGWLAKGYEIQDGGN